MSLPQINPAPTNTPFKNLTSIPVTHLPLSQIQTPSLFRVYTQPAFDIQFSQPAASSVTFNDDGIMQECVSCDAQDVIDGILSEELMAGSQPLQTSTPAPSSHTSTFDFRNIETVNQPTLVVNTVKKIWLILVPIKGQSIFNFGSNLCQNIFNFGSNQGSEYF